MFHRALPDKPAWMIAEVAGKFMAIKVDRNAVPVGQSYDPCNVNLGLLANGHVARWKRIFFDEGRAKDLVDKLNAKSPLILVTHN